MSESRKHRPDRDGDLGRLLRAAGPRPGVPDERVRRARAAAREAWRETVRTRTPGRRRGARVVLVAAALVVVALATWTVTRRSGPPPGADPVALGPVRVLRAVGPATWVDDRGGKHAVRPGQAIDDAVAWLTPVGGRLALRWPTGHEVRLDGDTRLGRVLEGRPELRDGAIYVDSAPGGERAVAALAVETPRGAVVELGTQYELRLGAGDALRIRVREGAVRLDPDDADVRIEAGEELSIASDGTLDIRSVAPDDRSWAWLRGVERTFVLDGNTLADFLAWAERERGVRFRFADPAAAALAGEIALAGGSLEGLETDVALTAVLTTCGWTWRRDEVDGTVELTAGP